MPEKKPSPKKLTLREQREWETIEAAIHAAEKDAARWQKTIEDPAVMASREKMTDACEQLTRAQTEVARLFDRWQELEEKMLS